MGIVALGDCALTTNPELSNSRNHVFPKSQEVHMIGSILGLLHLIVSIWAIINVVQSRESTGSKVLWTVLIIIFPLVGLLIWFFAGPRKD
jgi:uncharacterized membrane protein YkgB